MRKVQAVLGVFVSRSLQAQMILLLEFLVLVQIGISGIIFGDLIGEVLEDQIGRRTLAVAETVARDPLVVERVTAGDPDGRVQALGAELGVSRSTARRYLEYVVSTGFLEADVSYGSVGRPERRYTRRR